MSKRPVEKPATPGGPDPADRLQLSKAIERARLAVAWERLWPNIARGLTVAGLFLAVSWFGIWESLPLGGRMVGLAVFGLLALAALVPFAWFRWPTRADALQRLDRGSGIRHRPATALTDTLASPDPVARALWQAQRERTLASLKRIKAGLPTPRLVLHDPWAIRALVIVLMLATFISAGPERWDRVAAAFDVSGAMAGADVRLDAWVTPPAYTGRPPIVLSGASTSNATAPSGAIAVPAGSVLVVRASSGSLDIAVNGGLSDAGAADKSDKTEKPAAAGTEERRFTIAADGSAQVRSPVSHSRWQFTAVPDKPPTISLARDPERQSRGALLLSYKLVDDYGVTEAHAQFQLSRSATQPPAAPSAATADGSAPPNDAKTDQAKKPDTTSAALPPRPLFEPPQYPLVLPNARTRNGVGQTVKDLTEDPYAGADVTLTLSARDDAGNEGRSEPFEMRLPERLFAKPLARALIEQRRNLALDANKAGLVYDALGALLIEPDVFMPELGQYLGLNDVYEQLKHASTDDKLREVVASLWSLAVLIEDGDISDVDKALRAAQDALRQALERGASDDEIRKLTDQLRQALDNFMRQLAEQAKNNPQQLARPLDKNTRFLSEQDLKNMIDRLERMARSGDRDAARQLLDQLQSMLENLQMARPNQGDGDMEQSMNELGDVIRKQQQLRDRTFKQGQDSRRDRMRGQRDDQNAMNDLQRDQQALRNRLRKLLDDLARQGMMPKGDQQGDDGDQGPMGQIDQGADSLSDADHSMDQAGDQLGDGDPDSAVDSQGKALDSLRRGAQQLAQQMQEMGDDEGTGPGDRAGRKEANGRERTDPLGRGYRDNLYDDGSTARIPGEMDVQRARRVLQELRKRLGEAGRPQVELDYLERLLKDY